MSKPTVLITGAFTGIGRATAIAFAKTGVNIVVSGQNEEKGELMIKELSNFKIDADYVFADVRQEEDVRNLVDWTKIRFGSLDTAVNIAETEGRSGLIVDQSVENFNAVFETTVRGTFLSLKHEMRIMMKQKSGVTVNFLSTFGEPGEIGCGISLAGRRAVEELTRSAALEAANENVRVNAVVSGASSPEEIAKTIVFLASDKAFSITGQIIDIDGGKIA
jgi:NAD(P)-dependent dehydrogenase (short-subunit alcohol dehydrogenase family)